MPIKFEKKKFNFLIHPDEYDLDIIAEAVRVFGLSKGSS